MGPVLAAPHRVLQLAALSSHPQGRLMVGVKDPTRVIEELPVGRMVDCFDSGNLGMNLRRVALHVLDELRLGVGRPGNQDDSGVRHGRCHAMQEVLIFRGVPAADGTGLVVQMPGRMLRMHDAFVRFKGIEVKDPGLVMVDPHGGVKVGCHDLYSGSC
jgi:hypothetical protein